MRSKLSNAVASVSVSNSAELKINWLELDVLFLVSSKEFTSGSFLKLHIVSSHDPSAYLSHKMHFYGNIMHLLRTCVMSFDTATFVRTEK